MKDKLKLWLRRLLLRQLIKLVDRAEERLQAWQVSLRDDLASHVVSVKQSPAVGHEQPEARKPIPARGEEAGSMGRRRLAAECSSQAGTRHHSPAATLVAGETFLQWEARKSGVAPVSKKTARRRRERVTASAFDLRFAR